MLPAGWWFISVPAAPWLCHFTQLFFPFPCCLTSDISFMLLCTLAPAPSATHSSSPHVPVYIQHSLAYRFMHLLTIIAVLIEILVTLGPVFFYIHISHTWTFSAQSRMTTYIHITSLCMIYTNTCRKLTGSCLI